MDENGDYQKRLAEALNERAGWLERSELPKLKEELRSYQTGFASLYNLYMKKGLLREDPYKQESKIGELEVPDGGSFSEADKLDELSLRLANYDNQLDFLVNFYQFSAEFLTIDRIKRILGLVRYVDWVHLIPDSQAPMTKAVAEMTNQVKTGSDPLTMSVISESLTHLNKSFTPITNYLKTLTEYQKEIFKLKIRDVSSAMPQNEASNIVMLKRKFVQANTGFPFYQDLADEVIKEDYSKDGPALREAVLKKLQITDSKPKTAKVEVNFKSILVDGIQGLGGTAAILTEIAAKLEENHALLENRQKTFMEKIKVFMQRMFNKEETAVIYEVEYMDPIRGVPVREKVNYQSFRGDLDRKIRTLSPLTFKGQTTGKLESMRDEQLTGFLDRNLRDMQNLHKILGALDDYFKSEVDRADREKIKGIKPELGTLKNAILRANAKRHEYSAQKEEEEQLKRLGVSSLSDGGSAAAL